jgi:excisionase family DNA binding protein
MTIWLTVGDVARALNVGPDVVRAYERRGRLHAVRTAGGVRLFSKTEVERFVREHSRRLQNRNQERKPLRGQREQLEAVRRQGARAMRSERT